MTQSIETLARRFGPFLLWLVLTVLSCGAAYSDLKQSDAELALQVAGLKQDHDQQEATFSRQLDRIESKLLSIEEHLRSSK